MKFYNDGEIAKEVIVIGGNHHNTLSILRSLGKKGIKSLLIIHSNEVKPYVCYSKYIKEYCIINQVEEITNAMYKLHQNTKKAIVIACSDGISSYLDCHRDSLSKDFILPGSNIQGQISKLMNKNTMIQLAAKNGITVPKSWIVTSTNPDIEDITYPCIVKPLVSKNGSKADITICTSRQELNDCLSNNKSKELQIQEYIMKDFEFQLIGCALNKENIIIPGASIILRQPKNTNTGFLRYIPIRKFAYDEYLCKEYIKKTGYRGLFSLEFIRDKNGTDYFMEINFRNDGNSICVLASGMNLPYIWYLYNCDCSLDRELDYDNMKEVLVMPEFDDIRHPLHGKISWRRWFVDVKNTDCFMEFCKSDQKPFWMYLYKQFKNKILG